MEAFAEEDLVPLLLAKGVVNHELVFPVLRPLAVKMAQIHWNPNILFQHHVEQSWIYLVFCQYAMNHFCREASVVVRRFGDAQA